MVSPGLGTGVTSPRIPRTSRRGRLPHALRGLLTFDENVKNTKNDLFSPLLIILVPKFVTLDLNSTSARNLFATDLCR